MGGVQKVSRAALMEAGCEPGDELRRVSLLDWQRVRLRVEHPIIERQQVVRGEEEVEVLECLGQ